MSDCGPSARPFDVGGAETCEYIGPDGIFWSRGPSVFFSSDLYSALKPVARIPVPPFQRALAVTRMGRRLGRQTLYNLLPLKDGSLFFSYGTEIGFIKDGTVTLISGRQRPTRILRGGLAFLPDGSIAFGEYFPNPQRGEVHLYNWRPGEASVRLLHTFGPGEIRHVHSVSLDPFNGRAVVATGDFGEESRLLSFDAEFKQFSVLGGGDERWRTISPQFRKEAIYFGTDAEYDQNVIYRYDRETGQLKPLADVNGPVFYSAPLGQGWVFATTAELCPSQTSPAANLYYLDRNTEEVSVIASFAKDRWSKKYFQFGVLNLPILGAHTDMLPVSGTALKGLDGRFVLVEA